MEEVKIQKRYINHINSLIEQMSALFPEDVNQLQKDYLVNNIKKSSLLLARSLQEDAAFKDLSFERQCTYIQIMAEWSFHKEIDLFRSGIPPKYWRIVMQKIWYTTWEVMYACVQNKAPDNVVLSVVERYVNRTYKDAVEDLKNSNIITPETEEKAKCQSNIEIMALEYLKERRTEKIKYYIKMCFILAIIGVIIAALVLKFKIYGVIGILIALVGYVFFSSERRY